MTPIAPNLHPDAILEVSKQLDTRSVFNFRCVSHATYTALSNNRFLELFMHWHPEVVQYAQSKKDPYFGFSALVQYHPDNCWKIACCALSTGIFKPNDSFVKEAAPVFLNGFRKGKAEKELRLKEICGSFYADPNSPIDQAWKASDYNVSSEVRDNEEKLTEQVYIFTEKQLEISLSTLYDSSVHTQDVIKDAQAIYGVFFGISRHFRSNEVEDVINLLKQEGISIKEELIPQCRLLSDLCKKSDAMIARSNALRDSYDSLEKERIDCEEKIKELNDCIDWTLTPRKDDLPPVLCGHRSTLKKEFNHVLARHKMLPMLTECAELITNIEKGITESTPQNLDRIRCLINSCGHDCQKLIWGQLYFYHAQKVTEDRWSEKHFHEYLPDLRFQVERGIKILRESVEKNTLPPWIW